MSVFEDNRQGWLGLIFIVLPQLVKFLNHSLGWQLPDLDFGSVDLDRTAEAVSTIGGGIMLAKAQPLGKKKRRY